MEFIIIILFANFSIFHWNLSYCKSPQVSKDTFLYSDGDQQVLYSHDQLYKHIIHIPVHMHAES